MGMGENDEALIDRLPLQTVRFTFRGDVILIFGAGFWRKGRQIYERENKIHRRTPRRRQSRS